MQVVIAPGLALDTGAANGDVARVSAARYRIWPVPGDVNATEAVAPGLSRAVEPAYVVELPWGGRLEGHYGDFASAVEAACEHLDADFG